LSRNKIGKAYLCIFVCFSTKATHLEVVSDLTTAFLNALKRFMARRDRCANLFSDNGTNFTGANSELQSFLQAWCKEIARALNVSWQISQWQGPRTWADSEKQL